MLWEIIVEDIGTKRPVNGCIDEGGENGEDCGEQHPGSGQTQKKKWKKGSENYSTKRLITAIPPGYIWKFKALHHGNPSATRCRVLFGCSGSVS
jgi:hypothetical protein